MRKLIIIAAITLMSATANAGQSRSLSLASTETPPVPEQVKTQQTADTPSPAVDPKLAVPQEQAKAPVVADKPAETTKPKTRHLSTEARIIYELHRHGIYW